MCIKMMYNIITFQNVAQYRTANFNKHKPRLILHQPIITAVINKCLESNYKLHFSCDRHLTSLICSCLFDVSSCWHPGPVRFGSWLSIQVERALLSTWSFFWGFPGF